MDSSAIEVLFTTPSRELCCIMFCRQATGPGLPGFQTCALQSNVQGAVFTVQGCMQVCEYKGSQGTYVLYPHRFMDIISLVLLDGQVLTK